MGPFGFQEIIFLFFIALIIFGPRKLPEIGKTLGKGLREFKKASDDLKSNWEEHLREADKPIHDLKQTIQDVKTDVTTAASLEDTPEQPPEGVNEAIQEPPQETETAQEPTAPSSTEETKPNGQTH